jgi:uncharacterized protein YkwD
MRKRWWVQGIAAVLVIGLVAWVAVTAGHHITWWTNDKREKVGLVSLVVRPSLVEIAVNHSRKMARQDRLFHRAKHPPRCSYWGENVGVGPTARAVFKAFVRSPEHLANMLNPQFHHIGIGAVRDKRGRLWITEEFCG